MVVRKWVMVIDYFFFGFCCVFVGCMCVWTCVCGVCVCGEVGALTVEGLFV